MNFLATLLLIPTLLQSSAAPKVRRLSVLSPFSTEIVFKYSYPIFIENQPLRRGAVECFVSRLKSTGMFTDAKVELKPTRDGEWVDIDITPTWNDRKDSILIGEIVFDGFESFDLIKLKQMVSERGLRSGISLWKLALWKIGNIVNGALSEIYDSDDLMQKKISDLGVAQPRFNIQLIDSVNVRMTISLKRDYPCGTQTHLRTSELTTLLGARE